MTLEVETGSDPIEGRICSGGVCLEFTGWLDFVGAMDRAMHPDATDPVAP